MHTPEPIGCGLEVSSNGKSILELGSKGIRGYCHSCVLKFDLSLLILYSYQAFGFRFLSECVMKSKKTVFLLNLEVSLQPYIIPLF
jgi:hypothetical protein